MSTQINDLGITFPDGTTQTTAVVNTGSATYVVNRYTSPATWIKPANLTAVKVTIIGSGGTGGGSLGNGPGQPAGTGGGGGGGGSSIYYAPAASIPGPQPITAGPGTNSFGGIATATSGSPGTPGIITGVSPGSGGGGGSASGGSINFPGTPGVPGGQGGWNGSSAIFAAQNYSSAPINGNPSSIYGGGGGGAGGNIPSRPSGGSPGPGIVIIEEYY